VQFDNTPIIDSRILVQIVHILGDHRCGLSVFHELSDCSVTVIWNGVLHRAIAGKASSPGLLSDVIGRDKVLEFNGFDLVPETCTWAAEIGYAGFRTDSSASEYDDSLGGVDHRTKLLYIIAANVHRADAAVSCGGLPRF
jgi:hypothetical protein